MSYDTARWLRALAIGFALGAHLASLLALNMGSVLYAAHLSTVVLLVVVAATRSAKRRAPTA